MMSKPQQTPEVEEIKKEVIKIVLHEDNLLN